jgi:UDP-N-acetylmuramoyl-tripeptide--D-alanyl-D-alanine ligase
MNLQVRELLNIKSVPVEIQGPAELLNKYVSGFSIDSRTIKPGEIFIAIKGDKFDGHQFIADVQASGASIAIVSKNWYESQDQKSAMGLYLIVPDTLVALQEIGRFYRQKFDFPLLALTGSNGKTTTKEMASAVLAEKYQVVKNRGNLNNHIGVPLSLFDFGEQHNFGVIEMGTNHFGEIARLAEIAQPTCGLITNIGPAHLEFFGSLEGVLKAKSELWQFLEQQGQIAFVNVDDTFLRSQIPAVKKVVTYGFENKADVQGKFLGLDAEGRPAFQIQGTRINLGIVGMHNIYNALAAVAVGLEFDLNLSQVKVALEKFLPTSKRMEVIRSKGMVIINDCYNSNPESARKSLLTLSQMKTDGKRIAVLADMLELGEWAAKEHRQMGDFVVSLGNIHFLLTFGPMSKLSTRQAKSLGLKNAIHFDDKKELIHYLKKSIAEKDIILIKGSRGMVMEQVTMGILEN